MSASNTSKSLSNATLSIQSGNGTWTNVGSMIITSSGTFFGYNTTDRFEIKDVIFNPPTTIIVWKNGEKTIVKQGSEDLYDEEKAFCWAIAKRALGTNSQIKRLIENANRPQEKIFKKNKKKLITTTDEDYDIPF